MSASPVIPASLAFRPNEAVEEGLVRILDQLSVYAAVILAHSPRKLSDSVHKTRVLVKRLRALLWFAKSAFSSSEMRQAKSSLRKASHLLAVPRDLAVTRSILQMLSRKTPSLTDRKSLIRLSRNSNRTSTFGGKTVQTFGEVAVILNRTMEEIEARVKTHSQWPSTSDRINQAFRATQKAGKRALKHDNPVEFHDWRKRAKRLLYLLQLTRTAPCRRTTRLAERVDDLQEKLGEYHDSVVVLDHLQTKAEGNSMLVKRSVNLLERRKCHLREEVRKIARHIDRSDPMAASM